MRYLLATLGSTGDVYPFLALGAELRQAGHQVTLLASPRYQAAATQAQLSFSPIPRTGAEPDLGAIISQMLEKPKRLDQLEIFYAGLAPILSTLLDETIALLPEHDVLVTSYLLPFLKNAARAAGRKCAVLVFCPNNIPFISHGPAEAPTVPPWAPSFLRGLHNRLGWSVGQKLLDALVNRHVGPALRARGLGKFHGFLRDPADLALVTVSPKLFPPVGILPKKYVYTGFLRWQPPPDERASGELAKAHALEHGGAPLTVLTFGSMNPKEAKENFRRFLIYWPHGLPLAVQANWPEGQNDSHRPEVLFVGPVPHDPLFEHAVIVVHHGGAGTTASALYAGRPQVIIPHLGDQAYWAEAARALGVARVVPRADWPAALVDTLQSILREKSMVLRAMDCAVILRAENGAAATARALEKL